MYVCMCVGVWVGVVVWRIDNCALSCNCLVEVGGGMKEDVDPGSPCEGIGI